MDTVEIRQNNQLICIPSNSMITVQEYSSKLPYTANWLIEQAKHSLLILLFVNHCEVTCGKSHLIMINFNVHNILIRQFNYLKKILMYNITNGTIK